MSRGCHRPGRHRPSARTSRCGYFSPLKRGVHGVYHHVSREQPHRYLSELDFRYNACKAPDSERASLALRGINGKRLTYRDSCRRAG